MYRQQAAMQCSQRSEPIPDPRSQSCQPNPYPGLYGQVFRRANAEFAISDCEARMRIIGGQWRSRRLLRPETDSTRPMPDRVKQAIFDMLGSRYDDPGALPPLLVADVFAGGGSMGLEALSRGAAFCSFFERDRQALEALCSNIESLGAGQESRVVAG